MKLVTFENNNHISIGAVKDDHVIDFSNSSLPNEMIEFIKLGEEGLDKANAVSYTHLTLPTTTPV